MSLHMDGVSGWPNRLTVELQIQRPEVQTPAPSGAQVSLHIDGVTGWRGGSIGRASGSGSKGPRFESPQEHKKKL